ncbi:MAG: hypothetical protein CMP23_08240 [Rickettsiales bacterium]|nr:hypothetical protein [Rickettsiales bacterium]|tara:strand:+ start:1494 stop:1844 length:351 start_codon:yes stop_codon:yes gene_type:complete
MNQSLSIANSGLQAQQSRVHAAAHNIANLTTDDFRPQQVALSSREGGGVRAEVSSAPNSGPPRFDPQSGELLGNFSGTDLPTEALTLISARRAYGANLALLRTELERGQELMRILE